MRSPSTETKSSSCSLQLEKACMQQQRPNAAKKKKKVKSPRKPECTVGFHGSCFVSLSTGQQCYLASLQTQSKYLLSCEAFWMLSDIHFSLYPVGTTTLYSALLSGTTYIYYLVLMKFFATTSETMIFKALLLALRHGNFTSTLTQCLCGQAQAFVGWLEELSLASLWAGAHTLAPLEQ